MSLDKTSENFTLNEKDVLHTTSFKSITRFQQQDKSLIEIVKEKPNKYSIKRFHGAGKMYPLICKHGGIVIPKQIEKSLIEWYHNIGYNIIQAKLEPNLILIKISTGKAYKSLYSICALNVIRDSF